ncbi:MAG: hypothetical protein JNL75_11965 [Chitinophagales bacterium]|nr:hypothetical protein [Chitinophagales bacterium]
MKILVIVGLTALYVCNIAYGQGIQALDTLTTIEFKGTLDEKLINQRKNLIRKGYLFASLDSIDKQNDSLSNWKLVPNRQFDSLILEIAIEGTQVEWHKIKGHSFVSLQYKLDYLLNAQIQKGYLRASYKFDTIKILNRKVIISYDFNLNKKYAIDSVRIHRSSNSFNIQFVQNYINRYFKDRNSFDWKAVVNQLRYFDFLELEKNPDFTILDSTAILNLYLQERKLNQVNAILGILSNAYNTEQVEFTGDVKLSFVNLFKRGIAFQLNWQKNLDNSQFLYSKINVPFVLNTKLGVGGLFNIEKFDTSFLRVQYQLGLNYHIQSNQMVTFYFRRNISTITGFSQNEVLNGKLPAHLDFSTSEIGLGYSLYKLNRPLFTRKGWSLETSFMAGNKSTFINSKIGELRNTNGESLAKLYQGIPLSQLTFSLMVDLNKYTSIGGDFVLKTRLDSKFWLSETISTGEMHYIGGNKLPRGFDDNSFIVPWYVSFSNELQYYLSEYFYSNIFVDVATLKNRLNNEVVSPIGLGVGLSFKASDNIFRINIGTGYLGESKFSLGSMKVHLSYASVF